MKNRRLKQIVFSLGIVLSLFASSISACVCRDAAEDHCQSLPSHEMKAENHSSHAEGEMVSAHHESADEHHHEAVSTDNYSVNISLDECCCARSAPKVFAKSETIKIEKQAIILQSNAPPLAAVSAPLKTVETIHFPKPFYLSDSVYNLKSPRAPPRS